MDDAVKKYHARRDARLKKRMDDDWITIKGTHVMVGENGDIVHGPDKLKGLSGKASGSKKGKSPEDYGLRRESSVDVERFNYFDTLSGRYGYELAQEMDEFGGDDMLVSYSKGDNIAYASIDEESDVLDGIISTGGGTGTQLLMRVMEYQKGKGKGIMWMADHESAIDYYKKIGMSKYISDRGKRKAVYEIDADQVDGAIETIKRMSGKKSGK